VPTYDYECTHCKHIFEHFQNINDPVLTKCPKCGNKLKRLIGSGSGIIFKGTGFYETDYKKKSGSKGDSCPKSKDGSCGGCHS
jgi:putative FmdB family regulatory protein